jgi:phage gp16-like protein
MAEDDYRQGLFDSTGKTSLKECSDAQLERVIAWLQSKGFRAQPRKGGAPAAHHPMARKARALWISLYHLGVVHNPAEAALEAFAKRQLGCERLVWARQSDANKLVEALKAMAERAGWRQRDMNGQRLSPLVLASSLCQCILARLRELGVAPDVWSLEQAAFKLCGIELQHDFDVSTWPAEQYHRLAAALGAKLREVAPHAAVEGDGQ